jgi:rhodanese-related sulfurtransferase
VVRLLKLPDETMVYPAHDYKGDMVSTIGEERAFNSRLQVKSVDDYVALMSSLNLPNPKMMDVAVPANMRSGLAQKIVADRGWALTAEDAKALLNDKDAALIDLREPQERRRDGIIPGSLHVTYPNVRASLQADGLLQQLARSSGKRLIFYCSFGWRSAMAVQAAQAAGLESSRHIDGGMQAWKNTEGPLVK